MVTNQVYLFFIFIINGILIGLLFDFFRISRKVIATNDFITYLEDTLFWILTGFIILYSIFTFNNGELRLFVFLGILMGVLFYMLFMSSYIIKINIKIINITKKILNILLAPFKVIWHIIQKILLKPVTFLIINIRKNSTNFAIKIYNRLKKKTRFVKKSKNIVKT